MAENRLFLGVENSATGRAWRDRLDERGAARALAIAQRHEIPELLARILAGRNVEADAVDAFLDPTIKRSMPDPNVLTAMPEAAARIADAVMRGESIAIFGDYDVDGATSAAVLARFLRHGGVEPIIHIPDRLFEGYGPNVEAVRALAARGATLLVTVDCGTTSIEPLSEAKALGMDVVVIDHHQADEALPPALAIVNPNRRDDLSGLGYLAAVGLVFMTVVAVNRELRARGFWTDARPEPDLLSFLDDVALGTVADVVPLIGLNRAFVAKGLLVLRRREQPGLVESHGCGAAVRAAGSLASRLSARAAHQCRRPHRPRRSRRAAAPGNRSDRSGKDRRRARPAQSRAAGDRAGDLGAGRSRGDGRARHRGERRRGHHRRGRLASRRRRPRRRAAEGEIRPACVSPLRSSPAASAPARAAPSPASISAARCAALSPKACWSRAAATPWRRA